MKIFVAGATGYVGGRLIPKLLEEGYSVTAFGRSKSKLRNRAWSRHPNLTLVEGNIFDPEKMRACLQGADVVYYLIHSMLPGEKDFQSADRNAATVMRDAAAQAEVKRIIYLSGLGEDSPSLSKHLKSRAEVADILRSGQVPVTVLRAAMIIGSGSASFEILRYLVDRLPMMITPRWVQTPSQPIAIRNVIQYLTGCLSHPETAGRTFDIGGPEILTYEKLMRTYAEEAGLKRRLIIPVPVFTPRLSSYWIHLVTPVPSSIARPLAEGLRNPVVCTENQIREMIPQKLLTPREAIHYALKSTLEDTAQSHWTDAGGRQVLEQAAPGDAEWAGGTVFSDRRRAEITGREADVWRKVLSIGGKNGWYHADFLWQLRGLMDRFAGGVGLRRGRRSQTDLRAGDALDFWRVAEVQDGENLILVAEMKLPGRAVLEFKTIRENGRAWLCQTAKFWPRGLWGIVYWFLVLPLHGYVFSGMLSKITQVKPFPAKNV